MHHRPPHTNNHHRAPPANHKASGNDTALYARALQHRGRLPVLFSAKQPPYRLCIALCVFGLVDLVGLAARDQRFGKG